MTVTVNGESYTCSTALKGADYVHLLDASGNNIASFYGIVDFSAFSISGGSWTTPAEANECNIAVVHEDGSIGKSDRKVCDIRSSSFHTIQVTGASNTISLPGTNAATHIIFIDATAYEWVIRHLLSISHSNSGTNWSITFDEAPTQSISITLYAINAS